MVLSRALLRRVALLLVKLVIWPTMSVERNHLWAVVGRTIELRAHRCTAPLVCRLKGFAIRHRGVMCTSGRHTTSCLLGGSGMGGLQQWTLSV